MNIEMLVMNVSGIVFFIVTLALFHMLTELASTVLEENKLNNKPV